MKHSDEHNSELLFRKILIISLIVYCAVVLGIALTPYKSIVKKDFRKQAAKPVEIHFKKTIPPQLSEEIKKRLEEERKKLLEEKRLTDEKHKKEDQERLEREKRKAEEQKRLEEEQKKTEKQKRKEEEKQRIAELKKKEDEQRKEEEQKKAVKEQNRAVAMNTGILKAMKGGGRFADNVVSTDEIDSAISAPSLKGSASGAARGQASTRNRIKGTAGIGDVSAALPMKQAGGLSGRRGDGSFGSRLSGKGDTTGGGGKGSSAARSQGSVKEVLASHRGSLDFIYRKALRDNPGLKGKVVIEFTIAPSGEIISTRIISSTVNDQAFEQQVLKRIQTWKFPPFPESGTTVIKYPLEFEPA